MCDLNFQNDRVRTSESSLLHKSNKNTGKLSKPTFSEHWKLKACNNPRSIFLYLAFFPQYYVYEAHVY